MKFVMVLGGLIASLLAFQNCSSDLGPSAGGSSSQQVTPNPNPGPLPLPSPGGPVQPTANNSMSDAKPYNPAANCPNGYGLYSMLNTTPAIASTWNHNLCVKPYAAGDTSVLSDTLLVAGSACTAGWELLYTINGGGTDFTQPKFLMNYTICIKRQTVPVTSSFVTYFYISAPNAACRPFDVATGDASFCSTGNTAGTCQGLQTVKLCKSIQ
jgi:hypothetical protein